MLNKLSPVYDIFIKSLYEVSENALENRIFEGVCIRHKNFTCPFPELQTKTIGPLRSPE
jgi:hypothetical protein